MEETLADSIPVFTHDDYLETAPYEFAYRFIEDKFHLERILTVMAERAKQVKIHNFRKIFSEYVKKKKTLSKAVSLDAVTQFEGQELELNCGDWQADEYGVSIETDYGEKFACSHPILPVLRLVNIDTGIEKLSLAYRKGKQWRHIVADKKTLASNNSILDLANVGVAVTSENSKLLVQYLHDIETLNYDDIPEKSSVSRLGWIDGEGFSPYVEDLIFDGDESFRTFFRSVHENGSYDKWLNLAQSVRKGASIPARIVLAASFASAMVSKADALSFFVHLWGSESGTGKTVALMLAASVWANPEKGQYWHTFNGTTVGQELSAGFVNSMPLILDEFQMMKNKKDFEQVVYMLSEGVGRTRGRIDGGLRKVPTWCNCILTSGEMPITNFVTGAGAFNRIMEIECVEKLFHDPVGEVLPVLRNHYGFAGKRFVERLQDQSSTEKAKELYQLYSKVIVESDTTEKQAMAGAILLAADELATEWIFQDHRNLKVEDINPYLQTKKEVDINERAYNYICEVIATNSSRFRTSDNNGELWGQIRDDKAIIVRNVFTRICEEGGYSSRAVLSWMVRKGIAEPSFEPGRKKAVPTKVVKINDNPVRCVVMQMLNDSQDFAEISMEDLPF